MRGADGLPVARPDPARRAGLRSGHSPYDLPRGHHGKTSAATTLADGQIPTSCGIVTRSSHKLGVATTATPAHRSGRHRDADHGDQAQEETAWPGLGCLFASPEAEQEATILVMPDTSPFFTTRQTTTCSTFGKGTKVNLGSVSGYYCPPPTRLRQW